MNKHSSQKPATLLRWAAAVAVVTGLAACGGGGGSDGSSGSSPGGGISPGGEPTGQARDDVPSAARQSGKSFVAWLKTMAVGGDETSEPIGVGMQAIPSDETSEPAAL